MKDQQNITIALLCISATLMLTIIFLAGGADEVTAATAESRIDGYVMVPGRVTESRDILYVVDLETEKLNAYVVDRDWQNRDIFLSAGPIDLGNLVNDAEAMRTGGGSGRTGRRR